MTPTIIAYSTADLLFGKIDREAMQRSVEQAVTEWNRVLAGLVVFQPWVKGCTDPLVLITFGHQFKPRPTTTETWATCTQFPGKLAPRWVIELKDNPRLNWKPLPVTRFGIWWRRVNGLAVGSISIVAVLLHELGHVLQLPHEEVEDLIMSESCAQRETIRPMEAKRYRTWFEKYIAAQQHD